MVYKTSQDEDLRGKKTDALENKPAILECTAYFVLSVTPITTVTISSYFLDVRLQEQPNLISYSLREYRLLLNELL
jgi:hypothetical protein